MLSPNKNIMMEVMIPNLEKAKQFGQLRHPVVKHRGVCGPHATYHAGATSSSTAKRSARCMIGKSPNLDRRVITGQVADLNRLEPDYLAFLQRGADLIFMDIPVELGRVLYGSSSAPNFQAPLFSCCYPGCEDARVPRT